MKKLLLSSVIVIAFIMYSLQQRTTSINMPVPVLSDAQSNTETVSPTISPGSNPPTDNIQINSQYRDGTYTGDTADAYYGNIQVTATIQNGKISDVRFLQYPNDRQNSIVINSQAMPLLKSEAIRAQNAKVDIISGATDTSQAFIESLSSALAQAH